MIHTIVVTALMIPVVITLSLLGIGLAVIILYTIVESSVKKEI